MRLIAFTDVSRSTGCNGSRGSSRRELTRAGVPPDGACMMREFTASNLKGHAEMRFRGCDQHLLAAAPVMRTP